MKVRCIHGYFIFEETRAGQLSEFMSLTGFELESNGDHFTFSDLVDAPNYSFLAKPYLLIPAIKTFEGHPWEVMRKNKLVYDFTKGLVVPLFSVTALAPVTEGSNYFLSTGMIVPGSLTEAGLRVTDYAAFFDYQQKTFKYSGVTLGTGI